MQSSSGAGAGESAGAGSSKKATIYVGGFAPEVNEEQLLQAFVTFGGSFKSSLSCHHFLILNLPSRG